MNVIYKSRANGEFAIVYYIYAHWLLNKSNSSKGEFHGTHGTPSRFATALLVSVFYMSSGDYGYIVYFSDVNTFWLVSRNKLL